METLSTELKDVINRRISAARPHEIMAIAAALTAIEIHAGKAATAAVKSVSDRFEIIDEELVRDHTTGLVWTRGFVPGGRRPWKESVEAASVFTTRGWKFRAPTIAERLGINDYSRHSPAIDTSAFRSEESGWEWTSTPYAESPEDCAWSVNFNDGYSNWSNRRYYGFVRGVRVGQ